MSSCAAPDRRPRGHAADRTLRGFSAIGACAGQNETLHTELIRDCLDHRMDTPNKQSISRLPIWSHCGKPGQKASLFQKLLSAGLWRVLPKRGHLATPCVPVDPTRATMASALPIDPSNVLLQNFPDVTCIDKARNNLMQEAVNTTSAVMMTFFDRMTIAPKVSQGTGALTKK